MIFKVDSSENEQMQDVELSTLDEFVAFVAKCGSGVTVHTYDNEPAVLEVYSDVQ